MKAYKIVRYYKDKLMSMNDPNSQFAVEYIQDQWTRPKLDSSLLFVFDNLINADNYYKSFTWYHRFKMQIWLCEVGEVFQTLLPVDCPSDISIEMLWKKEDVKVQNIIGSYGTDQVKLLERLYSDCI